MPSKKFLEPDFFKSSKKILITGARGFIGSNLYKQLIKQKHKLILTSRSPWTRKNTQNKKDITYVQYSQENPEQLEKTLENEKVDLVFHLSAQSSVAASWKNKSKTFHSNLMETINISEILSRFNSPPLFFASTSEVYHPMTTIATEKIELDKRPNNPYGLSKWYCEQYLRDINYPRYLIARFFPMIGTNQKDSFVIPSFCRQVSKIKKNNERLSVGNLNVSRYFMSIEDGIKAILLITNNASNREIINVSSTKITSLKQILLHLKELSNIDFEIYVDPHKLRPIDNSGEQLSQPNKTLIQMGWKEEKNLKQQLNEILKYYESRN